jgi:hypothetical protein
MVAILCASKKSVYKSIDGLDVYDVDRDCRTFTGGQPVVAHPPCRAWSRFCRHQAKPLPGEKELAPFCVDAIRANGGVLEHPAYSLLWDELGLPKPSQPCRGELWSIEVLQRWWGHRQTKRTWLLVSGLKPADLPPIPYQLRAGGDKRRWQLMSKAERMATPRAFAEWLIDAASRCGNGEGE